MIYEVGVRFLEARVFGEALEVETGHGAPGDIPVRDIGDLGHSVLHQGDGDFHPAEINGERAQGGRQPQQDDQ